MHDVARVRDVAAVGQRRAEVRAYLRAAAAAGSCGALALALLAAAAHEPKVDALLLLRRLERVVEIACPSETPARATAMATSTSDAETGGGAPSIEKSL